MLSAPARAVRKSLATALLLSVTVALAACSGSAAAGELASTSTATTQATQDTSKPNIVYVLTDDMSMNLLQYMPTVKLMQEQGSSFSQYFTTDSLCCPARASIFTGKYPHTTGIYRNYGKQGGYEKFMSTDLDSNTFGTDLQKAGYKTAMMGKLLNEYETSKETPEGWDEWALAGMAYKQYDYTLNENGTEVKYGSDPEDYMTDVLGARGRDFVARKAANNEPFMLEVASFTPHKPYPVAERHKSLYPNLKAPQTAAYDQQPKNAPAWMSGKKLTKAEKKKMDKDFRKRVLGLQAVDDLVRTLWEQIRASGIEDNTYLVFSSDNGYHMGEYGLVSGKMTAYDTDVQVPLVVVGPNVKANNTIDTLASNIDIRATFNEMAGLEAPADCDGQSLAGLWGDTSKKASVVKDRGVILVEHRGPDLGTEDPDYQTFRSANPPSYEALRGKDFLYVEYKHGETEYYDLTKDPLELNNIAKTLSKKRLAELSAKVKQVEKCTGAAECGEAQKL